MCEHHTGSKDELEFTTFCRRLRRWLATSSLLDAPLAAAADLLDRRGTTWFECEISHVAWNSEDMHSALGAGVVLSLWNATRTGDFTLRE